MLPRKHQVPRRYDDEEVDGRRCCVMPDESLLYEGAMSDVSELDILSEFPSDECSTRRSTRATSRKDAIMPADYQRLTLSSQWRPTGGYSSPYASEPAGCSRHTGDSVDHAAADGVLLEQEYCVFFQPSPPERNENHKPFMRRQYSPTLAETVKDEAMVPEMGATTSPKEKASAVSSPAEPPEHSTHTPCKPTTPKTKCFERKRS